MNLERVNKLYFLGIGGIGMSAIARHFLAKGKEVYGYDKTPSELTTELSKEGAIIHFEDNINLIPKNPDIIIYTPAIPKDLKEFEYLKNSGIPFIKRAEVLGLLSENKPTIAVAGTHGKTTVSSIIAHILKSANYNFSAFLGGIATNYNSNFITNGIPEWIVAEADEFDRSFLQLSPEIAVITAIDSDHLDIYKNKEALVESFEMFANKVKAGGKLILKQTIKQPKNYKEKLLRYHSTLSSDLFAENVIIENGKYYADFRGAIKKNKILLGLPGLHNLENAIAAALVAKNIGIDDDVIVRALATYKGVKRRFEFCFNDGEKIFIDDYAHHPEEIKACIKAAKELFPEKKILGVFQPHLFSRTRDFAKEFSESLSMLNELIMMDIYPARENPIEGITSELILDNVKLKNKSIVSMEMLVDSISKKDFDVLITMGAGDIDRFIQPIKQMLETNKK
jgi:UDP-N-acetylmuramate--alanine ligase